MRINRLLFPEIGEVEFSADNRAYMGETIDFDKEQRNHSLNIFPAEIQ